ncbi:MAG: aminomethyl-transferring glycine dehydrogenase subunit GcvPA [Xylanivirga thermophila]|jgi:glycine dehydrogenase subunit 1|uniref:aminomethyl-transferring glycine dehydrogenase subunit GcvPA n=1 Tax=Xylanivirga thermophila TaxID=2496273 RepID=UPI00101C53A8|nr:aminomethyl-transferring glycine dehydrogenase subunit GcvPA [Xylanivirga thermophila]
MSGYVPNTWEEQSKMLSELGYHHMEELFNDIPDSLKLKTDMDLPKSMSEIELKKHMQSLANKNRNIEDNACFLGAGAYDHYIPSTVDYVLNRGEFYTAYTPYQPEISQGTLQSIFEYQTMICELTGMEISNASIYDGATALTEAALMACGVTRRQEVLVASNVHPEARQVLNTYASCRGIKVTEIAHKEGIVDLDLLKKALSNDVSAVIVQTPNFFGFIEQIQPIIELVHEYKALFIAYVDPISLSILTPPGNFGADIVVGEGQALGNPLGFGGPYLGFFATTRKLMRKMPGRVVGETHDLDGKRGFVLTLQTREQHIRRDKATSNICSNQNLNALAAAVYMSTLGKCGIREVAKLSLNKAHYLFEKLVSIQGVEPAFRDSPVFFKEFPLSISIPPLKLNKKLLEYNIIGGYELSSVYPEISNGWLIAVTEKRTKDEMDRLVEKVGELV